MRHHMHIGHGGDTISSSKPYSGIMMRQRPELFANDIYDQQSAQGRNNFISPVLDRHQNYSGSTAMATKSGGHGMHRIGGGNQVNHQQANLVKRELMPEFNKAAAEVPIKRKRPDAGIIYERGKEIGESMYQTLVTRDTTPGGMRHHHAHHIAQMSHNPDQSDLNDNENSIRIEGPSREMQ